MRRRSWLAPVLAVLCAAGCSGTDSVESSYDFLGRIVAADTSEWQTTDGSVTTGHPEFDFRVGPGVLTLEDGTELVVPPDTPGGNMCVLLAEDRWDGGIPNLCFAIGEYVDEGPEVAWFGLVGDGPDLPRGHIRVILHDVADGQAVVDEVGRLFRFDLAGVIQLDCVDEPDEVGALETLPRAALHYALLDVAAGQVYGVECAYPA